MRSIFSLCAVLIFLQPIYALSSIAGPTLKADQLQTQLERHIKKLPKQMDLSLRVEELGTGRVIASHNEDQSMVPASGLKIISSIAALETLGPSATVKTKVFIDGRVINNEVQGSLVVKGEGDPYLVSERLWLLARDVQRRGIKNITGGIKVDSSFFDNDEGNLTQLGAGQPFAAKLSATSVNFNSVEIHVVPTKKGSKPIVEFGPINHDYGEIKNDVRQVGGRSRNVSVERNLAKGGKEEFRVIGTIGRRAKPKILYYAVDDPKAHFAYVFKRMLEREGVQVAKGYEGVAKAEESTLLGEVESLPLLDLVRLMNTYSNNFMAEQIFRILGARKYGAPGTISKGRKAVEAYMKSIPSCKEDGVVVPNGSGLTWESKVSSRCFVAILQKNYHEFRSFADVVGSMPVGNETGTLKPRFRKFGDWFDPWKVRAKTGTLWSQGAVTSLVGFVSTKSGEILVFSIIQNHKRKGSGPIQSMREWEEKTIGFLQKLDLSADKK